VAQPVSTIATIVLANNGSLVKIALRLFMSSLFVLW
jgi:hypothetical protein